MRAQIYAQAQLKSASFIGMQQGAFVSLPVPWLHCCLPPEAPLAKS